jgi:hypothetical protein
VTASPPSVFGCHRGLFTIAPPVGCRSALSRGPGAAGSRPDREAVPQEALIGDCLTAVSLRMSSRLIHYRSSGWLPQRIKPRTWCCG